MRGIKSCADVAHALDWFFNSFPSHSRDRVTLILTCLTHEQIVQVSDRRLTTIDGKPIDDTANKAIFYAPAAAFSYTGIAQIGSKRTHEWIVDQLTGGQQIGDVLDGLQNALNNTVPQLPYSYKGLAVVGCFWATRPPGVKPDSAHFYLISNIHELGQPLATPSNKFTRYYKYLPLSQPFLLVPAGQDVPEKHLRGVMRNIRRSIGDSVRRGTSLSGESIGLLMVKAMREVSAVNARVGPSVIEIILPNRQMPALQGAPNSFAYFHGSSDERVIYAPALVNDQMKITDFWIRSGDHSALWPKK
jgi:hypothetical protein